MLEQIRRNGRVYDVKPGEKSVLSKPAVIPQYEFGPYRPVTIYRMNDNEMWVKDEAHGDWYHYRGSSYDMELISKEDVYETSVQGCFYLYGMARKGEETFPYFVQDMPYVQKPLIPDVQHMQMPFSMLMLDYGRMFVYPKGLKELLKDCPVAYADRFKRPIVREAGHTYPISLKNQPSKWEDLPESTYPTVADLSGTNFAVLDLEPVHTMEEEAVYESITGYYEEETMRGGKHKLVRLDDTTFKFRYGHGLELIANGMITFYGINGLMLMSDPPPMKTTGFAPVGHVARMMKPMDMPEDVVSLVQKLEAYVSDVPARKARILARHQSNEDNSSREFNILLDLYRELFVNYREEFPENVLPWMLAASASGIIEPREKHETRRNGLPYLVYLSAIICERKEGARIWRPT